MASSAESFRVPDSVLQNCLGKAKVVKSEALGVGKFLSLSEVVYADQEGGERKWEVVRRVNAADKKAHVDCVEILGIHSSAKEGKRLVMILQYRPPLNCVSVEFPAGMVDEGEDLKTAALRELREECGFTGTVRGISPGVTYEPGMTCERGALVYVDIDGDHLDNVNAKQLLEEDEFITVLLVPLPDLMATLDSLNARGCQIEGKLYAYALGLQHSSMTDY